jgi:hypothetical protein
MVPMLLPAPSAKKGGTYLSQTGGEVAKVSGINKISVIGTGGYCWPIFFTDLDRCI